MEQLTLRQLQALIETADSSDSMPGFVHALCGMMARILATRIKPEMREDFLTRWIASLREMCKDLERTESAAGSPQDFAMAFEQLLAGLRHGQRVSGAEPGDEDEGHPENGPNPGPNDGPKAGPLKH